MQPAGRGSKLVWTVCLRTVSKNATIFLNIRAFTFQHQSNAYNKILRIALANTNAGYS